MSILDRIKKTEVSAPRIMIYGPPGIGKSTLAAQFPRPLFLLTEETGLRGVDAFPVAKSLTEFHDNLRGLLDVEDLPYDTLVIDSVSRLDALVAETVVQSDIEATKRKNVTLSSACGGYGAGFEKAATIHRWLKGVLNQFQERGVGVVFVSHSAVKTHRAPDADDFDVYTIVANHDKTRAVYVDDCDAVLFCKLKSDVVTTESGRHIAKSLDERVIMAGVNPVNVSKNRFGMPDEIPMKFEVLKKYIPFYNKKGDK